MYSRLFKRIVDFSMATIILILLLPVVLIVILILLFVNNGIPFFLQKRPGKNEKIFTLLKFKTMTDEKDQFGNLIADDKRLTIVGRFLRKTSLDELPQLVNVVKGDMSIIGPRPLSVKYLRLYNEIQRRRHEVLPGITGLAQVNGRNTLTWSKRFEYDIWYVDNLNIILDLKILLLTIKKVIKRENVVEAGASSIQSFNGKE